MTKVLVLGASGRIAGLVIDLLDEQDDITLTLLARDTDRIASVPSGASVIAGDVNDRETLATVVRDQDIVYANLAGDIDNQAREPSWR